jgi:TatD DNase family protein
MKFIDTHSHLDICKNHYAIIENAKKANVRILTCGINIETNRKTLELAKKYEEVEACLGIYPTDCLKLSDKKIDKEIEFIKQNKDKIVAISEVGLDLKEADESTLEKQKSNLQKFIDLAKELDKPIIIHSRKAEAEAIELLEKSNYKKIIMHCFSGKIKLVKQIIENGWSLSIPTNVKHAEHFQNVIELTPIEQLFCETDSPYLHPDKKFPNESANVVESYKKIAEIKGLSLEETGKKIEENYNRLF